MKSKRSNQSMFAGIVWVTKTHGSKVGATCGKNSRAYERGDQFQKRIQLMADWANFMSTTNVPGQKVVPLRRGL